MESCPNSTGVTAGLCERRFEVRFWNSVVELRVQRFLNTTSNLPAVINEQKYMRQDYVSVDRHAAVCPIRHRPLNEELQPFSKNCAFVFDLYVFVTFISYIYVFFKFIK